MPQVFALNEKKLVKCEGCPAAKDSIFCGLEPGIKEFLGLRIQSRIYVRGSSIFHENVQPQAVYCLASGRVKLATGSSNGRMVIASLVGPGAILGAKDVLLDSPHDLTATAIEDSRLCILPKESFLEALHHSPDLSLRVARQMGVELSEICRKFSRAVCRPLSERLAELLLSLCRTHGQPTPNGITLRGNLGQEELSELLGVSRRSLNRALAELRQLGLIRCCRRSILIPDSRTLCDWLAVIG
jgi:CRP-like cAMP-binding protein